MATDSRKQAEPKVDRSERQREEESKEAAEGILTPGMPPEGAGLMLEANPRLNRRSETETELQELLESNAEADRKADKDSQKT